MDLQELGNLLREQGRAECLDSFEEARILCQCINDKSEEAVIAFNLGAAYMEISEIFDLDQSQYWYEKNLELLDENDYFGHSGAISQLGQIAFRRFEETRFAKDAVKVQLRHLNDANNAYRLALTLTPPEATGELAIIHNALGGIWGSAGNYSLALEHCRKAINYAEMAENLHVVGQACSNAALFLALSGQDEEALLYAHLALQKFALCGEGIQLEVENVQNLIKTLNEL